MKNLDNIVSAINHLRDDIKAEAIVADIIENGVSADDIVTIPDGLFKRRVFLFLIGILIVDVHSICRDRRQALTYPDVAHEFGFTALKVCNDPIGLNMDLLRNIISSRLRGLRQAERGCYDTGYQRH